MSIPSLTRMSSSKNSTSFGNKQMNKLKTKKSFNTRIHLLVLKPDPFFFTFLRITILIRIFVIKNGSFMLSQCGLEPGDDGDVLTEKSGFPFYPPPYFFSAGTLALSPVLLFL